MIYTVVAYRWGWLNNHQYAVAATANADRASDLASEEHEGRGGKYGVAVYEWSDDETSKLVEYHPSSYGEDRPFENHRLTMFSSVGHDAHQVATSGVHWEAPNGSSAMVPRAVPIPRWLRESVFRNEVQNRFMDAVCRDIADRRTPAGATEPRAPRDQERWTKQTYACIQREVRAMLAAAPSKRAEAQARWTARREAAKAQVPVEPGTATSTAAGSDPVVDTSG